MTDQPLKGVLVVDFGIHGAGSSCGKTLADWGADVIKVEAPNGDASRVSGLQLGLPCTEEDNIHFEMINGNKRSIVIDMKTGEGKRILERLLGRANIFFSNMRLGALKKMGLDYESMSARHPHIIWGHLSGYGLEGPRASEPGFDVVSYWASTGLLMDFSEGGYAPNTAPFGVGDLAAGAMLAGGLAACLYQQVKTGKGQKVMNSLFGHAVWTAGCLMQSTSRGDQFPKSRKQAITPFSNSYRCRDEWFFIAVMDYPGKFPLLCRMIGREDLAQDPRFATLDAARANETELIGLFDDYFIRHDWAEVDAKLTELDIAHNRIAHFADLAQDEQALANHYVYPFTARGGRTDLIAGTPIKFGRNDAPVHRNAPLLGEHTVEIMRQYGYLDNEINDLLEKKVIRQHPQTV